MANKRIEEIGAAGEELTALVFKNMGHNVVLSENKYDQDKDMIIDDKETEVKTQTVFRLFSSDDIFRKPAFTIDIATDYGKIYHNQFEKCKKVERLIFVARSSLNDKVVRIYEAPAPENRKFYVTVNKHDKRKVAGILVSDMTLIKEIRNKKVVDYFMDNWKGR